jgi:hypothetical protein
MNPLKKYIPWVLAIFFGLVYLLTPTKLYYWDGVVFAQLCEYGTPHELLHPHHLIYNLVLDIVYELLRMHFPGLRALPFLIVVSSIFGALTIYFSHMVFRTIFNREGLAVATTSFMGFAFSFWHFSTDASPYIISAFFPVLVAYLLLSMDNAPHPKARTLWAAFMFVVGMLFHQVVIFFYLVYAFWMCVFRFKDRKKRFPAYARIILIFVPALITGIIYFELGYIFYQYSTFQDYWLWITAYGRQSRWWYASEHSGILPFLIAIKLAHIKLFFYLDYIRFDLFRLREPIGLDIFKKIIAWISLITVFLVLLRGIIYLVGAVGRRRFYAALLLLWIAPYFVFFIFFTPMYEFYRLYYLFPLMAIFALGLKGFFEKPLFEELDLPIRPNTLSGWVFILLAIFAIYNYTLGIKPQMNARNNKWLVNARAFIAGTPSDAILVVPYSKSFSYVADLVNYFGKQGILFAEPYKPIVGPMPELVGPMPLEDETVRQFAWQDVEVKPGLIPSVEKMWFHEAMMKGTQNDWKLFRYRFPDTKVYLEDIIELPRLELFPEKVRLGSITYVPGKSYFVVPDAD